jgi:hypothetical protein
MVRVLSLLLCAWLFVIYDYGYVQGIKHVLPLGKNQK